MTRPLSARRVGFIKNAITEHAHCYKEIASLTHTSEIHARQVLKALYEQGQIHIAAWKRTFRNYAAMYQWGPGKDAVRPAAMTSTEAARKRRAALRKDPLAEAFYLASMRARDRADRAAKRPSTWASALGVTC